MKAKVEIISGFLGAGKTTLIQKLLTANLNSEKTVLIENDFGEISIDASLLRGGGFEVKEMNSGCICCSLSGDFIRSIREIVEQFQPERILIEPSGVGKLSDVIKACNDEQIADIVQLRRTITVVDVKRCQKYLENFGEFFEDQIRYADAVLLSRVEEGTLEKVEQAKAMIKMLNPKAIVQEQCLSEAEVEKLLGKEKISKDRLCGLCADDHQHGDDCGCGHHHSAEDVFDTITMQLSGSYDLEDLRQRMERLSGLEFGEVLRGKGVIDTEKGRMNVQFLPQDIQIIPCGGEITPLCIIGKGLQEDEIVALFR